MPMLPPLTQLSETHLIGPRCQEWVLDGESHKCLREARLVWVGHSVLRPPYRMTRLRTPYSHVVACFGGRGHALIDGKVVDFLPGQVLLSPCGSTHAFEVAGAGPWRLAWVFFDDAKGPSLIPGTQTRLVSQEAGDFVTTMQMLAREAAGLAQLPVIRSLVTLLEVHARRLAGELPADPRLWRLWERVEADLAHPWTCAEMARFASVGEEQLRRLCQRHYRLSPMAQVGRLRMQRAGIWLRSSNLKVEAIAQRVGFGSLYSFSAAFKRWSGRSPRSFRGRISGER